MREALNTMVNAMGEQAIALAAVDDRVTALKRTLARQFPDLADELKGQIEEEQERSRAHLYELQVTLARVREAIGQIPALETAAAEADKKRGPSRTLAKTPARAAGKRAQAR